MNDFVPGETEDAQAGLLAQLRDLIPTAFADGGILDRGSLLKALGLDDNDETPAFTFSWSSIEMARTEARTATTATLVPDEATSLDWDTARDVLIEGDNLQVLKLLKRDMRGRSSSSTSTRLTTPATRSHTTTTSPCPKASTCERLVRWMTGAMRCRASLKPMVVSMTRDSR